MTEKTCPFQYDQALEVGPILCQEGECGLWVEYMDPDGLELAGCSFALHAVGALRQAEKPNH